MCATYLTLLPYNSSLANRHGQFLALCTFNGHFALGSITSSHVGSLAHVISWIRFNGFLEFQHSRPASEAEAASVRRLYLPAGFHPLDQNGLWSLHVAAELHKVSFGDCYRSEVLVEHGRLLRLWNWKGIYFQEEVGKQSEGCTMVHKRNRGQIAFLPQVTVDAAVGGTRRQFIPLWAAFFNLFGLKK